eukprot:gene25428-19794_t
MRARSHAGGPPPSFDGTCAGLLTVEQQEEEVRRKREREVAGWEGARPEDQARVERKAWWGEHVGTALHCLACAFHVPDVPLPRWWCPWLLCSPPRLPSPHTLGVGARTVHRRKGGLGGQLADADVAAAATHAGAAAGAAHAGADGGAEGDRCWDGAGAAAGGGG